MAVAESAPVMEMNCSMAAGSAMVEAAGVDGSKETSEERKGERKGRKRGEGQRGIRALQSPSIPAIPPTHPSSFVS